MRTVFFLFVIQGLLAPFSVPPVCGAVQRVAQGKESEIAARPVDSFRVQGLSMIDTVLQLGQEAGVPMGIEYVDRQSVEKPLTIILRRATLGEALDQILAHLNGYSWYIVGEVIIVTHEGAATGERNLLNHVLTEFAIPRCTLAQASNLLSMALRHDLHPDIQAFIGNYNPGDLEKVTGPMKLHNATVREVLNRLVSATGSTAWVVRVPPGHFNEVPNGGFWTLLEYEHPPRRYAEYLRNSVFGWNARAPHEAKK